MEYLSCKRNWQIENIYICIYTHTNINIWFLVKYVYIYFHFIFENNYEKSLKIHSTGDVYT